MYTPQHSTHEHQQQHDGRRTPAEQRYWTALLSHGPVTGLHGPCQRTYTHIYIPALLYTYICATRTAAPYARPRAPCAVQAWASAFVCLTACLPVGGATFAAEQWAGAAKVAGARTEG